MYDPRNILNKQPVAIAGALRSLLMVAVLLGLIMLDEKQLAGIALAAELLLGLFAWNASTPTAAPSLKTGATVTVLNHEGHDTGDSVTIATTPPGPTGHDAPPG